MLAAGKLHPKRLQKAATVSLILLRQDIIDYFSPVGRIHELIALTIGFEGGLVIPGRGYVRAARRNGRSHGARLRFRNRLSYSDGLHCFSLHEIPIEEIFVVFHLLSLELL